MRSRWWDDQACCLLRRPAPPGGERRRPGRRQRHLVEAGPPATVACRGAERRAVDHRLGCRRVQMQVRQPAEQSIDLTCTVNAKVNSRIRCDFHATRTGRSFHARPDCSRNWLRRCGFGCVTGRPASRDGAQWTVESKSSARRGTQRGLLRWNRGLAMRTTRSMVANSGHRLWFVPRSSHTPFLQGGGAPWSKASIRPQPLRYAQTATRWPQNSRRTSNGTRGWSMTLPPPLTVR